MKSKKLTQVIKEKNSIKLVRFIDYIPAFIANVFSVIFSTSIIFELKDVLNGYVLALLSVFIVLFLIQNEVIKVKEIRKVFSGKKNSLVAFSITFVISITLATIGMYFYTNKSTETKDISAINKTVELNNIDQKYQTEYNTIFNSIFEKTESYKQLNTELKYWKHASPANIEERADIRKKIENLQNVIIINKDNFEQNKKDNLIRLQSLIDNEKSITNAKYNNNVNKTKTNDFITYIFLCLIIITEFCTIILNKNIVDKKIQVDNFINTNIAKTYLIASNLLSSLYMSARKNWVNINNAKYSYANKDNILTWDEIKTIYNNFISLGILSIGEVRNENDKDLLYNELLLKENEAMKKLDEYFERFFTVL